MKRGIFTSGVLALVTCIALAMGWGYLDMPVWAKYLTLSGLSALGTAAVCWGFFPRAWPNWWNRVRREWKEGQARGWKEADAPQAPGSGSGNAIRRRKRNRASGRRA